LKTGLELYYIDNYTCDETIFWFYHEKEIVIYKIYLA